MEGPDNGGRHHHLVRLAYLCFQSYVLLDPTELVLSFKIFLFISQPRTQALSSGKERPWSELVT